MSGGQQSQKNAAKPSLPAYIQQSPSVIRVVQSRAENLYQQILHNLQAQYPHGIPESLRVNMRAQCQHQATEDIHTNVWDDLQTISQAAQRVHEELIPEFRAQHPNGISKQEMKKFMGNCLQQAKQQVESTLVEGNLIESIKNDMKQKQEQIQMQQHQQTQELATQLQTPSTTPLGPSAIPTIAPAKASAPNPVVQQNPQAGRGCFSQEQLTMNSAQRQQRMILQTPDALEQQAAPQGHQMNYPYQYPFAPMQEPVGVVESELNLASQSATVASTTGNISHNMEVNTQVLNPTLYRQATRMQFSAQAQVPPGTAPPLTYMEPKQKTKKGPIQPHEIEEAIDPIRGTMLEDLWGLFKNRIGRMLTTEEVFFCLIKQSSSLDADKNGLLRPLYYPGSRKHRQNDPVERTLAKRTRINSGPVQRHEIAAALPKEGIAIGELFALFPGRIGNNGEPTTEREFIHLVKNNSSYGADKLFRPLRSALGKHEHHDPMEASPAKRARRVLEKYSDLRVSHLKGLLKERGLTVSGIKDALIARLKENDTEKGLEQGQQVRQWQQKEIEMQERPNWSRDWRLEVQEEDQPMDLQMQQVQQTPSLLERQREAGMNEERLLRDEPEFQAESPHHPQAVKHSEIKQSVSDVYGLQSDPFNPSELQRRDIRLSQDEMIEGVSTANEVRVLGNNPVEPAEPQEHDIAATQDKVVQDIRKSKDSKTFQDGLLDPALKDCEIRQFQAEMEERILKKREGHSVMAPGEILRKMIAKRQKTLMKEQEKFRGQQAALMTLVKDHEKLRVQQTALMDETAEDEREAGMADGLPMDIDQPTNQERQSESISAVHLPTKNNPTPSNLQTANPKTEKMWSIPRTIPPMVLQALQKMTQAGPRAQHPDGFPVFPSPPPIPPFLKEAFRTSLRQTPITDSYPPFSKEAIMNLLQQDDFDSFQIPISKDEDGEPVPKRCKSFVDQGKDEREDVEDEEDDDEENPTEAFDPGVASLMSGTSMLATEEDLHESLPQLTKTIAAMHPSKPLGDIFQLIYESEDVHQEMPVAVFAGLKASLGLPSAGSDHQTIPQLLETKHPTYTRSPLSESEWFKWRSTQAFKSPKEILDDLKAHPRSKSWPAGWEKRFESAWPHTLEARWSVGDFKLTHSSGDCVRPYRADFLPILELKSQIRWQNHIIPSTMSDSWQSYPAPFTTSDGDWWSFLEHENIFGRHPVTNNLLVLCRECRETLFIKLDANIKRFLETTDLRWSSYIRRRLKDPSDKVSELQIGPTKARFAAFFWIRDEDMTDKANELLKLRIDGIKMMWWNESKGLEKELEVYCRNNDMVAAAKIRKLLGKVDQVWISILMKIIKETRPTCTICEKWGHDSTVCRLTEKISDKEIERNRKEVDKLYQQMKPPTETETEVKTSGTDVIDHD